MPNQYKPDKRTLGELLSTTSQRIEVPEFQRDYSWTVAQVASFWDDLMAFSKRYTDENIKGEEYFLGPMVLVNQADYFQVLDGQQRLATATILLSVIRDQLRRLSNSDAANRTQQKYIADKDDYSGVQSYSLTLNIFDRDFFKREIQTDRQEGYVEPLAQLESHKMIRKARNYFEGRFGEAYAHLSNEGDKQHWVMRIQKVLTDHISVVAVVSDDEDNAASVFETLNDRGIGLSSPNLLRTLLLRRAESGQREEIIECWRDLMDISQEAKVEDFLRHFWVSRRGDVKTQGLYREIKTEIIDKDIDSLSFSRELQEEARVYLQIVRSEDENDEIKKLLAEREDLGAKALLPLFLSAFAILDLDSRKRLFRDTISLYVRHSVICGRDNAKLESLLFNLAKDVRAGISLSKVRQRIEEFAPSDDDFEKEFHSCSISKQSSARYILKCIEKYKRGTDELDVENSRRVTLEHIYPRNPRAQKWVDHEDWVNRLGNLTIIDHRMNREARAGEFDAKKLIYQRSQLILNTDICQHNGWDSRRIEERQKELASVAKDVWPIG